MIFNIMETKSALPPKWFPEEIKSLKEIRRRLAGEIAASPPYPEIIGDRRIIRFLRGRDGNVDEATKLYGEFLKWRKENTVDEVRDKILYGGINHPYKFPNGEEIIRLAPQIVIAPNDRDYMDQPVTLETYGFDPKAVLERVSIDQYLLFLIYCLEYRALILEQFSHEKEKELIRENHILMEGYGVVMKLCTIRDLKGVLFM